MSDLVAFSCRTGDLTLHNIQGPTAVDGIRAHQKLQQERSAECDAEVSIKVRIPVHDTIVTLTGRIDILNTSASPPVIQEIKSTLVTPRLIPAEVQALHWSQLNVYGFSYLYQQSQKKEQGAAVPDQLTLELLWFNLQDQSTTVETRIVEFSEVTRFTYNALESYVAWIKAVEEWREKTKKSAQSLNFPFTGFRAGQRDMAAATYRNFRDAGYLLCEAPTGIGKTISTLFPAVKAIGDGHVNKVVYLTAKTSGRAIAIESVKNMRGAGLEVTSMIIQSKALVCYCSNGGCKRLDDGRCPMTLGFFDRLPKARNELLALGDISASALDQIAQRHQLCPFELSLQMLPWVTLVVCDYNYVFDPLVRLPCFSIPDKRLALLLDESHNLVDRARNMYSARLTRGQNRLVEKSCKNTHPVLAKALSGLTRAMDRWAKESDTNESVSSKPPQKITKAVERVLEAMQDERESQLGLPDSARDWFKELFRYRVIEELFSEQHKTVTLQRVSNGYKEIEIRLMCVNADKYLRQSFKQFRSVIAFSATLRPRDYYHRALGLPDNTQGMELVSPFNPDHLGVYICPFIDTRYKARDQSLDNLVELINRIYRARAGNYLVFFPSYAYLLQVSSAFKKKFPDIQLVEQLRSFTLEERANFLVNFEDDNKVLGFAIMGGVFGEGVDFRGERLIGCIVVGTGLPSIGIEQQLISEDYETQGLNGFDYAFRYPGFTKVLQTAGRVIRSGEDRGVVVLVDQRFSDPFYRPLFPAHWSVNLCRTVTETEFAVKEFWQAFQ